MPPRIIAMLRQHGHTPDCCCFWAGLSAIGSSCAAAPAPPPAYRFTQRCQASRLVLVGRERRTSGHLRVEQRFRTAPERQGQGSVFAWLWPYVVPRRADCTPTRPFRPLSVSPGTPHGNCCKFVKPRGPEPQAQQRSLPGTLASLALSSSECLCLALKVREVLPDCTLSLRSDAACYPVERDGPCAPRAPLSRVHHP